jgi:hypothetical protein
MLTIAFGILHCFAVIADDQQRILHFNVTERPTNTWDCQQLYAALRYDSAPGYHL